MTVAALVVSLVALAFAGISLGWQIYTWRRSGPHVLVEVANTFPVFDTPLGGRQVGDHHLQVTAHNAGRAAISITSWGFRMPNGSTIVARPVTWSSPMPLPRLEPGSEASWFTEASEIRRVCDEHGVRYDVVKAFVTVAGGEKVFAKTGLPIG